MNTQKKYIFTSNFEEFISLTYITLLLVSFVFPKGKVLDVMGIQWFFMGILNAITAFILMFNSKLTPNFKVFNYSKITLFYALFILCSGISVIYASNFLEGVLPFVKLVNIFCSFLILSFFAHKKVNIFNQFAIIIALSLFFEAFLILFQYYLNFVQKGVLTRSLLRSTAGNVNFMASSIILKIPFIIYLIFENKKDNWFYKLTFFLGLLLLFPLTSRTNNLNLIILLLLLPLFLYWTKSLQTKQKHLFTIYLLSLLAFGIYKVQTFDFQKQQTNTVVKLNSETKKLKQKEVFESELLNSGSRFELWNFGYELWKKNPVFGNGLGSYKIDVIPLESKIYSSWQISKHPHNDFIQIAVESGLITSLLYLSIFVIIFIKSIQNLKKNSSENEYNWLQFIVLGSIIAFGIDSMLNFPLHVARNQIQFVFILFLFLLSQESKQKNNAISKFLLITVLVFSIILTIPNFLYVKSLRGQNLAFVDEGAMKYSIETIEEKLPNYPSLTERGFQIKAIKAKYLIKENKFDEALQLLENSDYENPYYTYNQYVKSLLYEKKGTIDSVIKYKKIGFEMYPLVHAKFKFYLMYLKKANRIEEMYDAKKYADQYIKSERYDKLFDKILNSKIEDLSINKN